MTFNELIRLLERNGFKLIKDGGAAGLKRRGEDQ